MPKVIGNNSLIARINEVEGCMYRQSNELGRLNRAVKKYKDENHKLRELVRYMHRCYISGHDWGPWGAPEKQHVEDIMRELGIEVKS